MSWTSSADLRAQVQKLWDKGDLLRPLVRSQAFTPRRLRLNAPSSTELSERFDAVRVWAAELRAMPRLRLVLREFRHRVLGNNALPDEVWFDTLDDALALIGKQKEAKRFAAMVRLTGQGVYGSLLPWLEKRPLTALALTDVWPRLLSVVGWLHAHPRPGIYLRQIDLPGVDSKFIEAHRGILTELLDAVLAPEALDLAALGAAQFCRRYGFKDKPLRIRFRLLDLSLALPGSGTDQDISLTQADFAQLRLPVRRVFMTENEVNFLAFPAQADSLVIFGAGYGFEAFSGAAWLHACELYYWGDIDTHGFAILDQLRVHFPHTQSLLMDRATLLAHAQQWGNEPQPLLRDLPRLVPAEAELFNTLRDNRLQPHLRLEQERISFGWLEQALRNIA